MPSLKLTMEKPHLKQIYMVFWIWIVSKNFPSSWLLQLEQNSKSWLQQIPNWLVRKHLRYGLVRTNLKLGSILIACQKLFHPANFFKVINHCTRHVLSIPFMPAANSNKILPLIYIFMQKHTFLSVKLQILLDTSKWSRAYFLLET